MNVALRLVLMTMVPLVLASSCTLKKDAAKVVQDNLPEGEPSISFEKGTLRLKDQVISVEVAQSPSQRSRGLMYRKNVAEGQGMLFLFGSPDYLTFYMKNTFVPLSIAFLDANKVIVDIQDMAPAQPGQESFPLYISKEEAQYALEVPQGWFQKRSIGIGDKADWSL